jgi:hypothetical protein
MDEIGSPRRTNWREDDCIKQLGGEVTRRKIIRETEKYEVR